MKAGSSQLTSVKLFSIGNLGTPYLIPWRSISQATHSLAWLESLVSSCPAIRTT